MSNPDDLDDGLVYDFSETEDNVVSDSNAEQTEDVNVETEEQNSKKREASEKVDETKTLSKRQKKLQGSKLRQKKKEQIDFEISKKKAIPKSNTDTIAEFFATYIREKNPNLSALELDDLYLKKSNFISTESFTDERDLNNLSTFMIKYSRAPKAIVFSMTNMRVADVARQLGGGKSAIKLFAKNKLDQDVNSGKNESNAKGIKYFVATPNRMEKILENTDAIFQGKDKLDIILDASFLDNKDNSLIAFENTMVLCKVLKKILDNKRLDLNKLSFGFEMGRMSHLTIVMDVEGDTIPFATFQPQFGGDDLPFVNNIAHVNWDQVLDIYGYDPTRDYFSPMFKLLTGGTIPALTQAEYMLLKDCERTTTGFVYSIVSSNLDGIQQSINELRESQAILIITMRKISQSLKQEDKLLYESEDFKLWSKELTSLESRLKVLYKRYSKLSLKNQSLLQQSTADSNSTS
ncbi:hypothetical protein C6P44_001053 [Monosporozyma unispora]|nr:hypothetical protein C6P44_001053 [Kazachstania unispora]